MNNKCVKIKSFNCCGVKNKLPIIHLLCDSVDILLLQETWIMPDEVRCLDNVHLDFNVFSRSSVNNQSLLSGRPYGGLSILWRKSLDLSVSVVDFEDNRLLGFW